MSDGPNSDESNTNKHEDDPAGSATGSPVPSDPPRPVQPPKFWGAAAQRPDAPMPPVPAPEDPVPADPPGEPLPVESPSPAPAFAAPDSHEPFQTPASSAPFTNPHVQPPGDGNVPPSGSVPPPPAPSDGVGFAAPGSSNPGVTNPAFPAPGGNPSTPPAFTPPSKSASPRTFSLRPLTVADILDETFQILKGNWKQLGIATLILAIPAGIVQAVSRAAAGDTGPDFGGGAGLLSYVSAFTQPQADVSTNREIIIGICSVLSLLLGLFLQPFVEGAVTRMVAAAYLGRRMTATMALASVRKLYWAFVGATFMSGLMLIAGFAVFLVGILAAMVLIAVVIPVVAVEEDGVFNAIGRSWALMKRRFWGYLAVLLLVGIASSIAAAAISLPPNLLSILFSSLGLDPVAVVLQAIGAVVGQLIAFPISAVTAVLLYFDARVRFEGFDMQLMAARIPHTPSADHGTGPN